MEFFVLRVEGDSSTVEWVVNKISGKIRKPKHQILQKPVIALADTCLIAIAEMVA